MTLAERVLEAIEAKVAAVNACDHYNPDDGGFYSCPAIWPEDKGDLPAGACNCGMEAKKAEALRHLAAHRRMVEAYAEVEMFDDADAHPDSQADRAGGLGESVRILAWGYGVPLEQEET